MTLDFTLTEASDNLSVTIQDTTDDWGVGEIQSVYTSGNALIRPTILGVEYDPITVTSHFQSGLQELLAFVVTADMLLIGGQAQFTAGDTVPDGDWSVFYDVTSGSGSNDVTKSTSVHGVVQKGVLDQIRVQDLNNWAFDNTLHEAAIKGAHYVYFVAMLSAYDQGDLVSYREALANLEVMLENGNY